MSVVVHIHEIKGALDLLLSSITALGCIQAVLMLYEGWEIGCALPVVDVTTDDLIPR